MSYSAGIAATPARGAVSDRFFYLGMAVVLAGIVVLGFSHTVPFDLQPPGMPAMLWVHGGVFLTWVLVAIAQPALARGGALRLHRRLGWAATGLAAAMLGLGGMAILLGLWSDHVPPFYPHGLFLVRGFLGLALFAGLLTAGLVRRRRRDWHKRLMLIATIVIIGPALERALPLGLFGAAWPLAADAALDTLVLAGVANDWVHRHRVHPAFLWGAGAVLTEQACVYALSFSAITPALLRLAGAH